MGLVAPGHVESFWTRDQTHVPCIVRWILNHWISRKVPHHHYLIIKPLSNYKAFSSPKRNPIFISNHCPVPPPSKLWQQLKSTFHLDGFVYSRIFHINRIQFIYLLPVFWVSYLRNHWVKLILITILFSSI